MLAMPRQKGEQGRMRGIDSSKRGENVTDGGRGVRGKYYANGASVHVFLQRSRTKMGHFNYSK